MPPSDPEHHPQPEIFPCAIYGRISEDPDQDADGVGRQVEDGEALIARQPGWVLYGKYVDNDISATKGKPRKEYQRLMRDVDAGRIRVIVVYTTSRLLRTRKEKFEAYELFARHGVRVQPVRGPALEFDSPAGRMLADILGAVDAHETEQMAERISRAMRQGAERGLYNGPRPFGYRQVLEPDAQGRPRFRGMLEPHETEAPEITAAADRILAGERASAIVRDWNARGVTTVRGKKWTVQRLQQMILGPYLAGLRATYPQGSDYLRIRDTPIAVHQGKWPPILTAERQDAIAAVLSGRRNPTRSGTNVKHMLSGLVTCGRCGGPAWTGAAAAAQGGAKRYACPKGHVGREAAAVERWAEYCIFHWWEPNGAVDAALEAEARARDGEDGVNLLADNRADRVLLERLEDKLADELLEVAAYKRQRRRIEDRIAARDDIIRKRQQRAEADGIPERGERLRARWQAEGLPFQWRVLAACVDRIIIHPVGKGGRAFDPRSIEVIPGGTLGSLDPRDPALTVPPPSAGLRRGREPRRKARAWLAANPDTEFTPRSLAAELDMSLASARVIVSSMRDDGEIVVTRPWRNSGKGPEEARYKAADGR
jgi:DNA invertase Pin-like site-specific DNA recombinase